MNTSCFVPFDYKISSNLSDLFFAASLYEKTNFYTTTKPSISYGHRFMRYGKEMLLDWNPKDQNALYFKSREKVLKRTETFASDFKKWKIWIIFL